MRFTILSFSVIILTCNQKGAIVKSSESFDTASFDPIIEHSQIRDTDAYMEPNDTLKMSESFVDSLHRRK